TCGPPFPRRLHTDDARACDARVPGTSVADDADVLELVGGLAGGGRVVRGGGGLALVDRSGRGRVVGGGRRGGGRGRLGFGRGVQRLPDAVADVGVVGGRGVGVLGGERQALDG